MNPLSHMLALLARAPGAWQDPGADDAADAATDAADAAGTDADAGPSVTEELMDEPLGLIGKWMDQAQTWVEENGPGIIVKIVVFVVVLFAFKILARIIAGVVRRGLDASRLKVSDLLKNFFVNVAAKGTMIAGILVALSAISVPIGPLLAGVGVLGFVVGFALQDTMGNFASGIMILLYRPYDIGDVVTAGGVTGKVTAMSLVSTTFLTPDNQVQIVPNSAIWGSVITNITANDTRRVDMTVGVGYDDDLDKVEKVLMEIVTAHEKVLKDPEPVIKVSNLGESSVDFVVRPWSKTSDYWDVYFDLNKTFKQRLDQEGISIPYPQRDIHVIRGDVDVAGGAKAG